MSEVPNLSCTGNIFKYSNEFKDPNINTAYLLSVIVICFLILLFFLYKMFKLCSLAFSYSHYHIHSTYRVYALAIVNIISTMIFRNNQRNLYQIEKEFKEEKIFVDLVGHYTFNNILGIVNLFINNIMLVFYSITWLSIALNCDYSLADEEQKTEDYYLSQLGDSQNYDEGENNTKAKIVRNRIRIKYLRYFLLYCLLPVLLLLALLGTLQHRLHDDWCTVVNFSLVTSSVLPLLVFGLAFGLYLKKFSDPEISLKIKIGLIYLFI